MMFVGAHVDQAGNGIDASLAGQIRRRIHPVEPDARIDPGGRARQAVIARSGVHEHRRPIGDVALTDERHPIRMFRQYMIDIDGVVVRLMSRDVMCVCMLALYQVVVNDGVGDIKLSVSKKPDAARPMSDIIDDRRVFDYEHPGGL